MKHLVLPRQISLLFFIVTLGLAGCSAPSDESKSEESSTQKNQQSAHATDHPETQSGNMLYIVSDVAELKSKVVYQKVC